MVVFVHQEGLTTTSQARHLINFVCAQILHLEVVISRIHVVYYWSVTCCYHSWAVLSSHVAEFWQQSSNVGDLSAPQSLFLISLVFYRVNDLGVEA